MRDRVAAPVPSVLRLVQAAVLGRWRATADELYREVGRLIEPPADLGRPPELLVSGTSTDGLASWLITNMRGGLTVAELEGADGAVRPAAEAAGEPAPRPHPWERRLVPPPVHREHTPLDDLPFADAVFDAVIGEPALSAARNPERAVAELVRVARPYAPIVLLQLTWSSDIEPEAYEAAVARLGVRPYLVVEWKQMLRDAGAVEIQVQDWTQGAPGGRPTPRTTEVPLLTWRQKAHILGRAWSRWGVRGARGAVARETELLHELTRERAIGFHLFAAVRWPHPRSA